MSRKTSSIKIVLAGPSNAGKTSIAKRFSTDTFNENQDMTVGSAFFSKQVHSSVHNIQTRVEIWDTAGQEKYRSMAPMYFRNAAGALLVFDQTEPTSYDALEEIWLPELIMYMNNITQFIIICANKSDVVPLDNSDHNTFIRRVEDHCKARGISLYYTSAKSGKNISEVFNQLIDNVINARLNDQNMFSIRETGDQGKMYIHPESNSHNNRKKLFRCCE
eukprot:Tbor_TRINITY_DN5772_c0_g3::TRINITY_DN5772_c0_g3_i1::g.20665::m.20665/K07889/RAB5C; Ras-related protein Rab-5C